MCKITKKKNRILWVKGFPSRANELEILPTRRWRSDLPSPARHACQWGGNIPTGQAMVCAYSGGGIFPIVRKWGDPSRVVVWMVGEIPLYHAKGGLPTSGGAMEGRPPPMKLLFLLLKKNSIFIFGIFCCISVFFKHWSLTCLTWTITSVSFIQVSFSIFYLMQN